MKRKIIYSLTRFEMLTYIERYPWQFLFLVPIWFATKITRDESFTSQKEQLETRLSYFQSKKNSTFKSAGDPHTHK